LSQQKQQVDVQQTISKLQLALSPIESKLEQLVETKEKLAAEVGELSQNHQALTTKRNAFFDGASVESVQTASKHKLASLKEARDKCLKQETDAKQTLVQIQTRLEASASQAQSLQTDVVGFETKWADTLKVSAFNTQSEFEAALLDEADFNELNALQIRLNKQLEQAKNTLLTIQADIDKLAEDPNASEYQKETLERVQALHTELTTQRDGLLSQQGALNQALETDKENKAKFEQQLEKIAIQEKVCEQLGHLNSLIGSAKGDAFRTFAQGLTLDYLTHLANQRLEQLHARYQLKRSDSKNLELTVCDTWQGDIQRDTKTLSGGESFLVSLALALALSDLVSNKISIDSLFLDEGFGTLDSNTLDMALSALERLNASGKLIGVISHIDSLKERIPVQIKVSSEAGAGVSRLEDCYKVAQS
jgi:exonuclease SbcC